MKIFNLTRPQWFILLLLFSIQQTSNSQKSGLEKIDSLRAGVASLTIDTAIIDHWISMASEFQAIFPDSGIYYGRLAHTRSQQIHWIHGEIRSLNIIAMNYSRKGVYETALSLYNQSLNLCTENNQRDLLAQVYAGKAIVHYYLEDYNKALGFLNQAIDLNKALNNQFQLANNYNNLGLIYLNQQRYPEAIKEYQNALQAALSSNNKRLIAYAYSNSGNAYAAISQFEKALEYQGKALVIEKEMGDMYGIATEYGSIASNFMGLYQQGHDESLKALLDSAVMYLQAGIELSKDREFPAERVTMIYTLSEAYRLKKDFEKAYAFYVEANLLQDSVFSSEQQQLIRDTEIKQEVMLREKEIEIQKLQLQKSRIVKIALVVGLVLLFVVIVLIYYNYQEQRKQNKVIETEKKKSEDLLLNILPAEVADELKQKGVSSARDYDEVTVLFTDFKNFTAMSEKLSAQELVNEINLCYSAFDIITANHNIEKIKTIGDSYMCAGGLPVARKTSAEDTVKAAIEMRDFMLKEREKRVAEGKPFFEIRIGCHTGPVVAGIVGLKKYAYDIWGDTVNIASRMESSGEPGKVNISSSTYSLIKEKFTCEYRGKIEAKNKGQVDMYFVLGCV